MLYYGTQFLQLENLKIINDPCSVHLPYILLSWQQILNDFKNFHNYDSPFQKCTSKWINLKKKRVVTKRTSKHTEWEHDGSAFLMQRVLSNSSRAPGDVPPSPASSQAIHVWKNHPLSPPTLVLDGLEGVSCRLLRRRRRRLEAGDDDGEDVEGSVA